MIVHHFGGTATQYQICNYVYPGQGYPDIGATIYQTDSAIDNYCWESGMVTIAPLSWTAVLYQTNNNGPIAAVWSYAYQQGHMVVIRGYDDQASTDYVYWCDPEDGYGHKNTYSWFKDNPSEFRHWVSSIFYK